NVLFVDPVIDIANACLREFYVFEVETYSLRGVARRVLGYRIIVDAVRVDLQGCFTACYGDAVKDQVTAQCSERVQLKRNLVSGEQRVHALMTVFNVYVGKDDGKPGETVEPGDVGLGDLDLGVEVFVRSADKFPDRSEEHTSELQTRENLVCRL